MKKNCIKKISFTLVAILLLVNWLAVAAFADDGEYVKWWLSDDQTQITNETENITYNYAFYGVSLRPVTKYIYVYGQYLDYYEDYAYSNVHINLDYPEVIWVESNGQAEFFVTDKGEADLKSFVDGNIGSLMLEDADGMVAHISKSLVAEWDEAIRADRDTEVFDVKDIKPSGRKVEVYYISAVDVNNTVAYNYGAVYRLSSGEYWYINYADLANNYFDADGNFSYRGGSVKMTRISDVSALEDVIFNTQYRSYNYTYEWDKIDRESNDESNENTWMALFWVFYAVCVVIPPIPMIILGFILPFIKKLGKPKYWYSLLAFALLWLIFAIALAILLIIV